MPFFFYPRIKIDKEGLWQMIYPQNNYMASGGITWVQGIEGAKAWQMMPNSNAILMDSENDGRFYIKVSDNIGMCNLRVFDYKEVTKPTTTPDMSMYVTRKELEDILNGKQSLQPTKQK